MRDTTRQLVRRALAEDIGREDLTTAAIVPPEARCRATLSAKSAGVLSGMRVFRMVFDMVRADVTDWRGDDDGKAFAPGEVLASFEGLAGPILTGERTAMNFAQHLSGVATLTRAFVNQVKGLDVRIVDTRKTTPGMRQLEKEAVLHGGGHNHRRALYDGILIKENHIQAAGGVAEAMARAKARAHHLMRIEIEVRDMTELDQAIGAGADCILLDNMGLDDLRAAVARCKGSNILLEASGNVRLENVRAVAETGVHVISSGALTHSAPAADLSLTIEHL